MTRAPRGMSSASIQRIVGLVTLKQHALGPSLLGLSRVALPSSNCWQARSSRPRRTQGLREVKLSECANTQRPWPVSDQHQLDLRPNTSRMPRGDRSVLGLSTSRCHRAGTGPGPVALAVSRLRQGLSSKSQSTGHGKSVCDNSEHHPAPPSVCN